MYYLALIETLFLLILLIWLMRNQLLIYKQHSKIEQLLKQQKKIETHMNRDVTIQTKGRRNAHRVNVFPIDCQITFLDFGNDQLETLKNKQLTGTIEDISISGLKFSCDYELPIKHNITTKIGFHIKNEPFSLKGRIIRKEDHYKGNKISYGVHFLNMHAKNTKQLHGILTQIEAEKKKMTG